MRRDRYLKFELDTSIGVVTGSISAANFLASSSEDLRVHGSWSSIDDVRNLLSEMGLRTDESEDFAKQVIQSWRRHEEDRKRRSWHHRES